MLEGNNFLEIILKIHEKDYQAVSYVSYSACRLSKPGPGPNVKFLPEVESVKIAVAELKKQGINKIISIGHAGIEVDKMVAKEVDGVDVVVGGHSHTFLYTGKALASSAGNS